MAGAQAGDREAYRAVLEDIGLVGMPALAPGQPVGLVVDPAQVPLFDRDGRLVR
jgi:hypothetical protein